MRRIESVTCDVDIAQTAETFHAHAIPDGVDIRPGDQVIVHGTPTVGFGGAITCRCPATVIRAGWFGRLRARLGGFFALADLYEVGFEARHTP